MRWYHPVLVDIGGAQCGDALLLDSEMTVQVAVDDGPDLVTDDVMPGDREYGLRMFRSEL